jgi:PhoH-like ATPase
MKSDSANPSKNSGKPKRSGVPSVRKLYVLDTNVLMHDPSSLFRFQEHDVFLPLGVIEELDNHKTGLSDVARNARHISRKLDELMSHMDGRHSSTSFADGFLLDPNHSEQSGRLFLQTIKETPHSVVCTELSPEKIDNQIIAITMKLKEEHCGGKYADVVLVSKDVNVRIKARAGGLRSEDYENDQVLDDASNLFTGVTRLSESELNDDRMPYTPLAGERPAEAEMPYYSIPVIPDIQLCVNQLVHDGSEFSAIVRDTEDGRVLIQRPRNYKKKHDILGVTARNCEQNFALNLLMDTKIPIVTLLGPAGSGKTLLTIVSGLRQMTARPFGNGTYQHMIMTRITVPVGEDIGFLPGTEQEKMSPWMGALSDNLEIIAQSYHAMYGESSEADAQRNAPRLVSKNNRRDADSETESTKQNVDPHYLNTFVRVRAINMMRGRTFVNTFLVIDEAQNLTPKQTKMLATRAGPGTKIVFLGNLAQIDTPYLTDTSSGLTHLAERFKDHSCYGHAILTEVVRSEVAQLAEELL